MSLPSLDSGQGRAVLCIFCTTQVRRSGKFSADSLGRARDQQPGPGAPGEGAETQTLPQDPAAPQSHRPSHRTLLLPDLQQGPAQIYSPSQNLRSTKTEGVRDLLSSPKVSSTGTKSQTQAPEPRCACSTQLVPAGSFPSFFFSRVKQKLSLDSNPRFRS